jgi:hypothetical protein
MAGMGFCPVACVVFFGAFAAKGYRRTPKNTGRADKKKTEMDLVY